MTSQEAWNAFRTWVVSQAGAIPVIQAYQNAPVPAKPYIAISRLSIPDGSDVVKQTASSGNSTNESIRNEYIGSCMVYAITDHGQAYPADILRNIFALRETTTNLKALSTAGICIRSVRGPNDVPRLDASSFVQEAVCQVKISFSHSQIATITDINTVIVSQDLPN